MIQRTKARLKSSLAFATLAFGISVVPAFAQSDSWNVNAPGTWGNTANWLGGTPPGTGGVATFGDTFSILGMSDGRTVTNDTNPTLSGITFDSNFIYTISGGTSINLAAGPFTLNANKFNGVTPTSFGVGHIVSSVLAGTTSSFDKIGSGTVTLTGTNTFTATGGVNLNAGELRTTAGDLAFGNVANSINFNGGALRVSSAAWTTSRTVNIGGSGAILNPFAAVTLNGAVNGLGRLTVRGSSGGLTIGGNSTGFSGEIQNELGTLNLSGLNSAVSGTAMLDIAGGLALTNTTNNNVNRIADTRDVTLRGALFSLLGNAAGTTENVGRLNLATGGSTISVTSAPAANATSTLRFAGLNRNNNSTVHFRGSNLGGGGAADSHIAFAASPGTLIGGGGALTTNVTNISILPFAAGSITATSTAPSELVSWDSGSGRIFVLGATNYAALGGAAANDNVSVSAATSVAGGGQTINALRLTSTLTGTPADILTITSGTIVASGTPLINADVNFGGAEGVLLSSSAITVNGVMSGSGGFTKGGTGTLTLRGANSYSGVTNLNGGGIRMNGNVTAGVNGAFGNDSSDIVMNSHSGASGAAATSNIWVDGGVTSTFNRGFVINAGGSSAIGLGTSGAVGDKLVINGNIQVNNLNNSNSNGFLRFEGDDVEDSLTVNGIISGNGGIADGFSSFVHLNGNNTYSGGTNMAGGTYILGHDNAFGTGTVWISAGTTNKIRAAFGPRTLANEFRLQSGDLAIGDNLIAGSNEFTLNGGIYLGGRNGATLNIGTLGSGTTVNGVISGGSFIKAGAGKLTVTAANTYTGTTAISGGALFVNNTTGSGTGLGAVASAIGTTLGGTGSMNGPVTVNGTLAPGASIESLASGALTMNAGSTFQYETLNNSATGADLMKVNGALSLNSVILDLSLANLAAGTWVLGDKLTLIAYGGTAITSGFTGFADDTIFIQGANQWLLNYNDTAQGTNYTGEAAGSANFITITAVPEPTSLLLVGIPMVLAGFRRRRA